MKMWIQDQVLQEMTRKVHSYVTFTVSQEKYSTKAVSYNKTMEFCNNV